MTLNFTSTDIISISGKRGSGKSVLSNIIIDNLVEKGINVSILDINNDYDIDGARRYRFKDLVEYRIFVNTISEKAMRSGNQFLIFDDADVIIDSNRMPANILDLIIRGRHKNVGAMFLFRRVNTMHKEIIFNANHFFIFKSKLLLDREYFNKNLDGNFDIINLKQYEFRYMNPINDLTFTGIVKEGNLIKC